MRRVILGIVALLAIVIVVLFFFTNRTVASPEQPIAFSHQNHVEARDIACGYCHEDAAVGFVASIPELEICMGCHATVGGDNPEVQKLRGYFERQEPVQWVKLTRLPDHVVFAHTPHIQAGVECLTCHGGAQGLTSAQWFQPFNPTMGWCLSCHRANNAPIDCWTCHK